MKTTNAAGRVQLEAMKLFAIHGFDGTSMEAIAKQVGIRKASLYSHFKGKEALFLSIVHDLVEDNKQSLQQLSKQVADQSIERQLHAYFRYLSEYPLEENKQFEFQFFRHMLFFPPAALYEELRLKLAEYESLLKVSLASVLKSGIEDEVIHVGPVEDLVTAFLCTADGVMMQIHYVPDKAFKQISETMWRMFWRGISV
ncbi:TetR/AcrR family transcriptional regulator [Amphibacillus cookii]|uniref:TetR/AcrR family transcriptional regulator n=1 Tax=Amphibacillus cookii TaxID=767787 RepID=UPI00195D3077|nr:TetR/AcrR family transcriptional regulator [Amphibacillus cookii]MBM7540116.1 AcrR family transcriptional regulator [Amphibacillus cookii]